MPRTGRTGAQPNTVDTQNGHAACFAARNLARIDPVAPDSLKACPISLAAKSEQPAA